SVHTAYRLRYGRNDLPGAKQARLDCADLEVFSEHLDLLANNPRTDRFNPRNFTWNFRDDARHGGQSINTESRKSFQVGLNTSAGTAVRPCNASRDGTTPSPHHCRSLPP